MKKLVLIAALLFTAKAYAQTFEGTIKWSMKMDITDPKQKAKMEEAKAKMNDPANQAKMKEMQEKMNDPQFKAMMDNNPQMKAQMEMAMKAMAGGDINSMMPKGITIKIKNKDALTKMEGGAFTSEILHLGDKDQTYTINRENKTYSLMNPPSDDKKPTSEPVVKVTKTSETAKILNYTCTKYIVEYTENGRTMTQYLWTTTEIKDIDFKAMAKQSSMRNHQRMYFDKVDGVPLRVEMKAPEGTMTMETTEIKRESLAASDFAIPSDYKKI